LRGSQKNANNASDQEADRMITTRCLQAGLACGTVTSWRGDRDAALSRPPLRPVAIYGWYFTWRVARRREATTAALPTSRRMACARPGAGYTHDIVSAALAGGCLRRRTDPGGRRARRAPDPGWTRSCTLNWTRPRRSIRRRLEGYRAAGSRADARAGFAACIRRAGLSARTRSVGRGHGEQDDGRTID